MSSRSAAVIDLQEFRRRKEEEARAPSAPLAVSPVSLPMWVCWVPVPAMPMAHLPVHPWLLG
jgi:hypothetical protein